MMGEYYIITLEEDFKETNNLFDACDMIKKLLKKGKRVVVISGNKIDGEQFLENVRRAFR